MTTDRLIERLRHEANMEPSPGMSDLLEQAANALSEIQSAAREYISEAHDGALAQDASCDHSVGICWCGYRRALETLTALAAPEGGALGTIPPLPFKVLIPDDEGY